MKLLGMFFQPGIKSDMDEREHIFVGFSFGSDEQTGDNVGFSCTIGQPVEQLLKNLKKFAETTEQQFIEKGYITNGTNKS